jgi:hypothetical protein
MKTCNYLKPALFGMALLLSLSCYGQWGVNLPVGVMPMQFNSSFAGEAEALRLNTTFSYYYSKFDQDLQRQQGAAYHASLDKFIPALKSGIGFTVSKVTYTSKSRRSKFEEHETDSDAGSYSLAVAIAPKLSIKGKYTFSPSLDFSYRRYNRISYFSQDRVQSNWLYSRIGLLFNTQKYYVGYSAFLIQDYGRQWLPDPGFFSYLQAGYTFQRSPESKFSVTSQLMYLLTDRDLKDGRVVIWPNLTFRYSQFMAGINHTGIHIGFQSEKTRIVLSSYLWGSREAGPFSSGNMAVRHIFKE